MDDEKRKMSTATDGVTPGYENSSAPGPINPATGQHSSYWVLSEEERSKGFVRPVRTAYRHLECGTVTKMSRAIAETYAREPGYYGSTFCVHCGGHFPVGEHGEFIWEGTQKQFGGDGKSDDAGEKVGT